MSLAADDLALARGGRWLVRGISFRLSAGTGLLVQGANGCGKSTLLRTLCGLHAAQAGAVRWNGQALPAALPALRGELAWLGFNQLRPLVGRAFQLDCFECRQKPDKSDVGQTGDRRSSEFRLACCHA